MKINGQCKFVMGACIGYMWCVWAFYDIQTKPFNGLAKFFIGLWTILGLALIDQTIELRREKRERGNGER